MAAELDGADWIARKVPEGTRIVRQITSTRTDLADAGHSLGQRFTSEGAIVAVSVTLAPPPDAADPFTADVKFTLALETPTGDVVAERTFEGPQLVWDYFGPLLDVDPPAPPASTWWCSVRSG